MSVSDARRKVELVRAMRVLLREQLDTAEAEGFGMLAYLIEMAMMETDIVEAELVKSN